MLQVTMQKAPIEMQPITEQNDSFDAIKNLLILGAKNFLEKELVDFENEVLNCLIILTEAAEELGLKLTAFQLDIAADLAMHEVQGTVISKSTLKHIVRISAENVEFEQLPATFASSRQKLIVD